MDLTRNMAVNADLEINVDNKKIKLITGEQVIQLFSQSLFQDQWDTLYNSCSWATAFQSRGFVFSWYRIFQDQFVPVVVVSHNPEGNLVGALPMAVSVADFESGGKVKLIGAGAFEAEYQAWIACDSYADNFIQSAFLLLMERFPKCDIVFRFIPQKSLLNGIENNPRLRKGAVIQSFRRPLMQTQSPDITKILTLQRQFKTKYNRLKRLGDVRFERILDIERFSEVLKELMVHFDFRQGAMFNKNQFRDNPERADFLLDLFRQNILHVTVLSVNGEIMASMAAVADKQWVHLQGLNTHSPFYSRYSPGILHFYLLGKLLLEDQVAVFDLTPGDDSYKERWATDHDTVYTLTLSWNWPFYIKRYLKKVTHDLLIKAGHRPMTVELLMEKKKYLLKNKGIRKALVNRKEEPHIVYRVNQLPFEDLRSTYAINKNHLGDLLDYEEDRRNELTRWEFTENAMVLLGEGKNVYTVSNSGKLLACVWESINQAKTDGQHQGSLLAENGIILSDLFCHASFINEFLAFLSAVSSRISNEAKEKVIYIQVSARGKHFFEAFEAAGLTVIV